MLGGTALHEEDIVGVGNREQGPASGDRLIENAIEILASVAAFSDAKALALKIEEGSGGGFENLVGKRGGTSGEVEDAGGGSRR